MSISEKMFITNFFRSSLLFVALFPTFYAHFSSPLPLFSLLVISSFLFPNTFFVCKKITSYDCERMVQTTRLPVQEGTTTKKMLQIEDIEVLDSTHVSDFTSNSLFEADLVIFDQEIELGPTTPNNLECNSILNLFEEEEEELKLEDVDEDYLIEIPLNEGCDLEEKLLNLVLSSNIDDISGEDNLIEIDLSMGSIRSSV